MDMHDDEGQLYEQAMTLCKQRQYQDALRLLNQVLELDPTDTNAL